MQSTIYYEIDKQGMCITPCPYKKKTEKFLILINVNSTRCKECKNFIKHLEFGSYISCDYEEKRTKVVKKFNKYAFISKKNNTLKDNNAKEIIEWVNAHPNDDKLNKIKDIIWKNKM